MRTLLMHFPLADQDMESMDDGHDTEQKGMFRSAFAVDTAVLAWLSA
jgi:hypothetical protein